MWPKVWQQIENGVKTITIWHRNILVWDLGKCYRSFCHHISVAKRWQSTTKTQWQYEKSTPIDNCDRKFGDKLAKKFSYRPFYILAPNSQAENYNSFGKKILPVNIHNCIQTISKTYKCFRTYSKQIIIITVIKYHQNTPVENHLSMAWRLCLIIWLIFLWLAHFPFLNITSRRLLSRAWFSIMRCFF